MDRKERFWLKVRRGPGCWQHSGSLGSHGYAQATGLDGRTSTAHRVAWILEHGALASSVVVRHLCKNPSKRCVRLDHLAIGTHDDNMDDFAKVGHPKRSLSFAQVRQIRESGRPLRELAREFGVSQRAVQNAKRGKTYRHAGDRIKPRRKRPAA